MKSNDQTIFISIITVGMNHLEYVKDLLHSIYVKHPPKITFEFIYVDNCSTDGSVNFIKTNYPDVYIIENDSIKGFGANNNYGVSKAKGKYVAIINPDIVLLEDSLDLLYDQMETERQIGIIAPQLLNKDLSIQHSVRSFISLKILFWRILSKGNDKSNNQNMRKYLQKDIEIEKEQPIDWAIGAALFMEKVFFHELNGFDEDYFLYMEDEDLCLRSWIKQRPVIYFPRAKMIHNHIRSSQKINKNTWRHIKSMYSFFKKHGLKEKTFISHRSS